MTRLKFTPEQKARIKKVEILHEATKVLVELGEKDAAFRLRVLSDHHLRRWD